VIAPAAIPRALRTKPLLWALPLALFALVGLAWSLANFTHNPAYGDTSEYWRLAHTLAVDSWRTLGYPLLLRLALLVQNPTMRLVLLYTLQIVASFAAILYFLNTLDLAAQKHPATRRNLLLAGLVALTPPIAHFNQSVLSDALASAAFVLASASILRVLTVVKPHRLDYVFAVIGIVASGLFRQDRLLCLVLLLLVLLAWLIWHLRFHAARAVALLLVVCIVTSWFNHRTQTAELGRPSISVPFMLFDRTTRGHLQALLPHMPKVIQQRITPAEAATWDSRQSYWPQIAASLSEHPGQVAMLRGSLVSVKRAGPSIAVHIAAETVQYIATPWMYAAYTVWPSLPGFGPTLWTNIHITQPSHLLGNIYLGLFVVVLLVATVLLSQGRRTLGFGRFAFAYLALIVVVNAVVNTLSSSLEFHIRYALPVFTIEAALGTWLLARFML
jgi:hypothetical protein